MHSERIVHHEHVSVGEFASADADGDAFHLAGNLLAEFFGDVLEHRLEASEAIHELGGVFDGAGLFFGLALLLEVFGSLREQPEVCADGNILAAEVFDDACGGAFELDACRT